MLTARKLSFGAFLVGLIGYGGSAFAATTYPGPFFGDDVTYSEVGESSGPGDPEPLYGMPEIDPPNTLDFDPGPNQFAASSDGQTNVDGNLTLNITGKNGSQITQVTVRELGDFSIGGLGTDSALVAANLTVFLFDEDGNDIGSGGDTFSATQASTGSQSGSWSNSVTFDVSQFDVSFVEVVLDNTLLAVATDSGSALIRKKDFDVIAVPEPASVGLLLTGLGLITYRRRRA
jgi:hypothetical protein